MFKASILLQHILPQRFLSRLSGRIAAVRSPRIKNWMIKRFIRNYEVDMQEAVEPEAEHYVDSNHFFTRAIKGELRPIAAGDNILVSPADGCISAFGAVEKNTLLQAKGFSYTLESLLAGDQSLAETFHHGQFLTVYLGPKDYHRVHMPENGVLKKMIYIPGKLFSVNALTAAHIPNLYARNERVVSVFQTAFGKMALVLVGAIFVASIETVWAGTIAPRRPRRMFSVDYPPSGPSPLTLRKGAEMGRFKFGSTVIALFEKETVHWDSRLQLGALLRMGTSIGTLHSPSEALQ